MARRAGVAGRSVTVRWTAVESLLLQALSTDASARHRPTGDLAADLLGFGSEMMSAEGSG